MSVSWVRLDALLKLSTVLSIAIAIFGLTPVSVQAYARTPQVSFADLTGRASQTLPIPVGFSVKASAGYSLFVFEVRSHGGRAARVILVVTGKHGSAIYAAPALVSDTSMEADLGALGKIAIAFHPSGEARTVHSSCDQRTVSFDSGFYEGTIEFHGEDGYTDVEATSAEGDIGFLLEFLCPGMSGTTGPSSALLGAELDAGSGGPRRDFELKIVKNHPRARTHVEVGVTETQQSDFDFAICEPGCRCGYVSIRSICS